MLQETLDLPSALVSESILDLKHIMDPESIEEMVEAAAEGEEESVRELLNSHIDQELVPLIPAFMELVAALVEAVGVEEPQEKGGSSSESESDGFMSDSSDSD